MTEAERNQLQSQLNDIQNALGALRQRREELQNNQSGGDDNVDDKLVRSLNLLATAIHEGRYYTRDVDGNKVVAEPNALAEQADALAKLLQNKNQMDPGGMATELKKYTQYFATVMKAQESLIEAQKKLSKEQIKQLRNNNKVDEKIAASEANMFKAKIGIIEEQLKEIKNKRRHDTWEAVKNVLNTDLSTIFPTFFKSQQNAQNNGQNNGQNPPNPQNGQNNQQQPINKRIYNESLEINSAYPKKILYEFISALTYRDQNGNGIPNNRITQKGNASIAELASYNSSNNSTARLTQPFNAPEKNAVFDSIWEKIRQEIVRAVPNTVKPEDLDDQIFLAASDLVQNYIREILKDLGKYKQEYQQALANQQQQANQNNGGGIFNRIFNRNNNNNGGNNGGNNPPTRDDIDKKFKNAENKIGDVFDKIIQILITPIDDNGTKRFRNQAEFTHDAQQFINQINPSDPQAIQETTTIEIIDDIMYQEMFERAKHAIGGVADSVANAFEENRLGSKARLDTKNLQDEAKKKWDSIVAGVRQKLNDHRIQPDQIFSTLMQDAYDAVTSNTFVDDFFRSLPNVPDSVQLNPNRRNPTQIQDNIKHNTLLKELKSIGSKFKDQMTKILLEPRDYVPSSANSYPGDTKQYKDLKNYYVGKLNIIDDYYNKLYSTNDDESIRALTLESSVDIIIVDDIFQESVWDAVKSVGGAVGGAVKTVGRGVKNLGLSAGNLVSSGVKSFRNADEAEAMRENIQFDSDLNQSPPGVSLSIKKILQHFDQEMSGIDYETISNSQNPKADLAHTIAKILNDTLITDITKSINEIDYELQYLDPNKIQSTLHPQTSDMIAQRDTINRDVAKIRAQHRSQNISQTSQTGGTPKKRRKKTGKNAIQQTINPNNPNNPTGP